ncbi:HXXEE domain-containing protein [bacterium]|nr:HXXEE domain-containing protein [bacterium]
MDISIFRNSELINHGLLDNASWLDANWMFLSLFFGVLLFLWLLLSPKWSGTFKEKLHNPKWLGYLVVVFYSVHQFEEHGFDIFGRRYMFTPVFNESIILDPSLGIELLPRAITLLNVLFIWGALLFWAKMSKPENSYYLVAMAWGFAILNGIVGHFLPIITQTGELRYVPGAFQSIFMVSFGLYVLLKVFKPLGVFRGFVLPLIFGIFFHITALIFPLLFFQIYFTWIPQEVIWPVFIGITATIPILATPLLKRVLKLKHWNHKTTG